MKSRFFNFSPQTKRQGVISFSMATLVAVISASAGILLERQQEIIRKLSSMDDKVFEESLSHLSGLAAEVAVNLRNTTPIPLSYITFAVTALTLTTYFLSNNLLAQPEKQSDLKAASLRH